MFLLADSTVQVLSKMVQALHQLVCGIESTPYEVWGIKAERFRTARRNDHPVVLWMSCAQVPQSPGAFGALALIMTNGDGNLATRNHSLAQRRRRLRSRYEHHTLPLWASQDRARLVIPTAQATERGLRGFRPGNLLSDTDRAAPESLSGGRSHVGSKRMGRDAWETRAQSTRCPTSYTGTSSPCSSTVLQHHCKTCHAEFSFGKDPFFECEELHM